MSIKAASTRQPNYPAILKAVLWTSLFVGYPYLVYQGIAYGMGWLAVVSCAGVCLYRAWFAGQTRARLLNSLCAIVLLLGAFYVQALTAKILPVLIQLMLMTLFGRTLLSNKGPAFIESVVLLQFPDSPPAVGLYCRRLTQIWTAFFGFNALMAAGLALWGSDYAWALYNGVLIYVLMGVLAIGEYIYRRIRFADLSLLHQGIPDLKSTVTSLFVNGRKVYLDTKER